MRSFESEWAEDVTSIMPSEDMGLNIKHLKGKYHENLMPFENSKTFVCQQKQENICLVSL